MNKVKVAAIQMRCAASLEENLKKAEAMVRKAAAEGANVILLPELFEREYFCQQRRYDFYHYAKPVMENDAECFISLHHVGASSLIQKQLVLFEVISIFLQHWQFVIRLSACAC